MENDYTDENYINSLEGKKRYELLLAQVDPEKLENWEKEQENLKNNLSNEDDPLVHDVIYIGGLDISYDNKSRKVGISGIVILEYKTLEIVYEDYNVVKIEEPYVPGFLAFREVKHFVKLIDDLKNNSPEFIPQVFLLDGNGILHSKGLGIACHLGVLEDIATIGCSKTVFSVDGITKDQVKLLSKENLKKKGDSFKLIGYSGKHWGYALKTSENEDPLIISMGNKISNETSLKIVKKVCKKRIPEPIRLADLLTRRLINARRKYGRNNNIWNWNLKEYYEQNKEYIHSNLIQEIDDKMDDDVLSWGKPIFNRGGRGRGRGWERGRGRGRFRGGERGRGNQEFNAFNDSNREKDNNDKDDNNIDDGEMENIRGRESGRYRGRFWERGRGRGRRFFRGMFRGRGRGRGSDD